MKTVTALGLGPISASKLNTLVNSGQVLKYEEGGKTKFMWNSVKKVNAENLKTYIPGTLKKFGIN